MPEGVPNYSNTVGFVDLDDLDSGQVTTVDLGLLQDAVHAAEILHAGQWYDSHVHLVHHEDVDNPAVAISSELSDNIAVMVAAREDREERNYHERD